MQLIQRESRTIVFDAQKVSDAIMKAFISANPGRMGLSQELEELINALLDEDDYVSRLERMMSFENLEQSRLPDHIPPKKRERKSKNRAEASRMRNLRLRRQQRSARISQGDVKSIAMDASMPVPPTMNMKGGQLYILSEGV